jgi:hypothetical protein
LRNMAIRRAGLDEVYARYFAQAEEVADAA